MSQMRLGVQQRKLSDLKFCAPNDVCFHHWFLDSLEKKEFFARIAPLEVVGESGLEEDEFDKLLVTVEKAGFYLFVVCCNLSEKLGVFAQYYIPGGRFPVFHQENGDASSDIIKQVHKPLCHSITKEIELRDEDFDYMPSSYTESICTNPEGESKIITKESHMCTFPGFECVQRIKTMNIAKRKKGSEIWNFYTQRIPSDCECMLPAIEVPSGNLQEN